MILLAMPILEALKPANVLLAFDSDARSKTQVAGALRRAVDTIRGAGFNVKVETWPSAYKGLDDLLAAKLQPTVSSASTAAFTTLLADSEFASNFSLDSLI
jgi:uncharacterized protein DUF3854